MGGWHCRDASVVWSSGFRPCAEGARCHINPDTKNHDSVKLCDFMLKTFPGWDQQRNSENAVKYKSAAKFQCTCLSNRFVVVSKVQMQIVDTKVFAVTSLYACMEFVFLDRENPGNYSQGLVHWCTCALPSGPNWKDPLRRTSADLDVDPSGLAFGKKCWKMLETTSTAFVMIRSRMFRKSVPQDVIVTNAELQGKNVISTSFHVSVDGMVNKTQRLLVKIKAGEGWEGTPWMKIKLSIPKKQTKRQLPTLVVVLEMRTCWWQQRSTTTNWLTHDQLRF